MEGWDSCKTGRRSARCTDRRSYCKAHRAASKVSSSSVVLTGKFTHFSDPASAHYVMQYHILNSIQQLRFVYIRRRRSRDDNRVSAYTLCSQGADLTSAKPHPPRRCCACRSRGWQPKRDVVLGTVLLHHRATRICVDGSQTADIPLRDQSTAGDT